MLPETVKKSCPKFPGSYPVKPVLLFFINGQNGNGILIISVIDYRLIEGGKGRMNPHKGDYDANNKHQQTRYQDEK